MMEGGHFYYAFLHPCDNLPSLFLYTLTQLKGQQLTTHFKDEQWKNLYAFNFLLEFIAHPSTRNDVMRDC